MRAVGTSESGKTEIIARRGLAFEQGTITIPNDPILIGELQQFEASTLPSGMVRYAAPAGGHDDCVMALAIAFSELTIGRARRISVEFIDEIMEMNRQLMRPSAWHMGGSFSDIGSRWES